MRLRLGGKLPLSICASNPLLYTYSMDRETIAIVLFGCIGWLVIYIVNPFGGPPKDLVFRGKRAKRFTTSQLFKGWLSLRGPFALYLADDGLWIGMYRKHFYSYADVQQLLKSDRNFYGLPFIRFVDGTSYHFDIAKQQRSEFYDMLKSKGVKIEETQT